MGRHGVGYLDIANAAIELQGKGVHPTVDTVREHLGTGSRSTIGPYLKQWRSRQEEQASINGIPPELASLVTGLYQNLQQDADRKIQTMEACAKTEIEVLQFQLNEKATQNASLEKEIQIQTTNLYELETKNSSLTLELDCEHKHNLVLSAKIEAYEQLLNDKTQHIQLLEKQFNSLQMNLEHYRESTNAQREKDKRAFEREISMSNQEINRLRQQLQTEWHENKGKIMELQENLKTRNLKTCDLENKYNVLSNEHQHILSQLNQSRDKYQHLEKDNLILKERLMWHLKSA